MLSGERLPADAQWRFPETITAPLTSAESRLMFGSGIRAKLAVSKQSCGSRDADLRSGCFTAQDTISSTLRTSIRCAIFSHLSVIVFGLAARDR